MFAAGRGVISTRVMMAAGFWLIAWGPGTGQQIVAILHTSVLGSAEGSKGAGDGGWVVVVLTTGVLV